MLRAWMTDSVKPGDAPRDAAGPLGGRSRPGRRRSATPHRLFLTDDGLRPTSARRSPRATVCSPQTVGRAGRRMVPVRPRPRSGRRPARGRCALAGVRDAAARPSRSRSSARRSSRSTSRPTSRSPTSRSGCATCIPIGRIAARELRRAEPHASRQPRRRRRRWCRASATGCACSSTMPARCFPAGHRIRLALSTTYWPMVWPAPETATVTIFGGTLDLPVRPAQRRGVAAAVARSGDGDARAAHGGPSGRRAHRSHRPRAGQRGQVRGRHQGRRSAQRRRRDAADPDDPARRLAGPDRNRDAPLLHARCLPAARRHCARGKATARSVIATGTAPSRAISRDQRPARSRWYTRAAVPLKIARFSSADAPATRRFSAFHSPA